MIDYRSHIIFLIIFIFCFSCKKEEKMIDKVIHNPSIYDTAQLPVLTGLKSTVQLTPKAKIATQNWNFYIQITQYLDSLGQGTVKQNMRFINLLDKAYIGLQEKQKENAAIIPSKLATLSIRARLTALETQIQVLKNEMEKTSPSTHRIATSIVRTKNALQDLNLQIDERFAPSIEEILEESNEQ